jgi:hypothetical protein
MAIAAISAFFKLSTRLANVTNAAEQRIPDQMSAKFLNDH